MSLITLAAGDIAEYHGSGTPTTARLFANKQFVDSAGIVVAKGSPSKPDFYQTFAVSMVGTTVRIASGDAYSTVDSSDALAKYTLVLYDANGRRLMTVYTNLRIPAAPSSTTWEALREYSTGRPIPDPSRPTTLQAYVDQQIALLRTEVESYALAIIEDEAYSESTWNGDTTHGASKNALRDQIEAILSAVTNAITTAESYADGKISDEAYDEDTWDGVTNRAPSKNAVRDLKVLLSTAIASKATTTYVDAKVVDSIADNDTTHAPSRNAVFDALTLKLDALKRILDVDTSDYIIGSGNLATSATDTFLQINVEAGATYRFRLTTILNLYNEGFQCKFAGTATFVGLSYAAQYFLKNSTTGAVLAGAALTNAGTAFQYTTLAAATGAHVLEIEGSFTVNAAGTMLLRAGAFTFASQGIEPLGGTFLCEKV